MSDSRASVHHERRSVLKPGISNAKSRLTASKAERIGDREGSHSPRAESTTSGRRMASGSHRQTREGEELRAERHKITTRGTTTHKPRSETDRRPPPSIAPSERGHRHTDSSSKYRVPETRPAPRRQGTPEIPWHPEATLVSHTTAPMAPRVLRPPLATVAPASLQLTPLNTLPLDMQEALILEDLLFVLMGYEGIYLRFAPGYDPTVEKLRLAGPTFKVLPGLDPSLRDLTSNMLMTATHYGAIEAFVEVQSREEFGAVSHALCAAIRRLLQDYLILIAQLETQFLTNPTFTLHVLNLRTLPTSHMMFQVYALAKEVLKKNSLLDDDDTEDSDEDYDNINNILESLKDGGSFGAGAVPGKKIWKGGSILGLITTRLGAMSGDPAARALLRGLLRDASRPYMTMLNEWLHHGSIKDPHAEFLVNERKSIKREHLDHDFTDEYWGHRYTLRPNDVPPQLEAVKDKVLKAGKYLNVVRECGGVDVSKAVKDVPRSFDDNRFLDNINSAYAHANESLLKLLVTTHELPARLTSFKHYFFLDQSDFFSYFLELGASELRKPVRSVNTTKLQSLLDLVLRQPGSIAAQDPFKEDIRVEMNETGLTAQLQKVINITGAEEGGLIVPASTTLEADKSAIGFTSLQLDCSVPFPVSLVISRHTVWRYQAMFRYLLSLRYLESQLVSSWQIHNRGTSWVHRSSDKAVEKWKRRVWTLRSRMLVFVQQLLYFCTAEVIEPNWQAFMARLESNDDGIDGPDGNGRTVDGLMRDHVSFMDTCMKECMLTNGKLLRVSSLYHLTSHILTY